MSFVDLATPVNSTTITMNERFSSLPQQITLAGPSYAQLGALRPASAKNRQLAELLEQRTSELLIQQALNLKKGAGRNIQRRLGLEAIGARNLRPVVSRLGFGVSARLGNTGVIQRQPAGRGRGRRRGRGGPNVIQRTGLRRSGSVQSLRRSNSTQSLNNVGRQSRPRSRLRMDQPQVQSVSIVRARSRSRSRVNLNAPQVRRGRSRSRGGNIAGGVIQRTGLRNRSRGRIQLQPRGGGVNTRGRGRGRSRSITRQAPRAGSQGPRGRGRGRGRGVRGRGGRGAIPSKDDLDKQLDQYMAASQETENYDMKTLAGYQSSFEPRFTGQVSDMEDHKLTLSSSYTMPMMGLGTWQAAPDVVEKVVETALEAGYRLFDTAYNYGNEEAIGKAVKKWVSAGGNRQDLFITTKLPNFGIRPEDVEKYLTDSLRRLDLDYLDLYLIHHPFGFLEPPGTEPKLDLKTDHIATWKAMEEQVSLGRVRSIGLSNFNAQQVERVAEAATIPISNLQVELHVYLQQPELLETCRRLGITATAFAPLGSPLARPHIKKKYNIDAPDKGSPLSDTTVLEIASRVGATPAQILLRFLIELGITVIPKSASLERIEENYKALEVQLTPEDVKALEALDKGEDGRIFDFLFWRGCDQHPEYPFAKQV